MRQGFGAQAVTNAWAPMVAGVVRGPSGVKTNS